MLACLLVPVVGHATQVQATLDRSTVQLGDTVTLNLRVTGSGGNVEVPDLSALRQDFAILGTSQNSSLSVINGQTSSMLTFGIALRPRHLGLLEIPALTVAGRQTKPLQLNVTAPDPAAAAATHKRVFMEAQVEPDHGYVGQQLSYVVRLYYAINISSGSLDTPQVDGMQVSRLGSDVNYDSERGGRQYHVLERRYALIPQRAGHVVIPALNFQGNVIDPNDPNSFFGASTPISTSAPAVSVEVKPVPAAWGSAAWLPARKLSLAMSGWPGAGEQARVGQPLNLSLELQATGLPFESLPALTLPTLDGATVYPDKPVTGSRDDGRWVVGRRQHAFAIVPTRAGTLTVPAISVKWWNVLTDQAEVAQIPAHSITVLPAIGGTAAPAAPAVGSSSGAPAAALPSTALSKSVVTWRNIALGSIAIALLLLGMLAWLLWRRRGATATPASAAHKPVKTSSRQLQLAFLAAARGPDVAAQAHALLAWARAERPAIQHLGELAAALDDAGQRAAIAALQRRQYGGVLADADDDSLATAFKPGFVWRAVDAGSDDEGLPPLYPFKLR
ncbi:MAG: protein BatD [Rhodanobacter sp.]|nr:MAG: protein BatD [Rhodanobacter sp.]